MYLRNILLVIGVVALVSGASLALLWVTQRSATVAVSTPVTVPGQAQPTGAPNTTRAILIAAHPIPSGTFLRSEDVTWKEVSPGAEPPDPMEIAKDADAESKYLGAVTAKEFSTGEPLLISKLVKPGDRAFLSTLLTPGTRAVSIAVDAAQSESGLLLPGNRVDIILTQTFDSNDATRKSVGETILKNLRVIAVDQRLGPAPAATGKTPNPETAIPKIVTLEVTEHEAQALMVAGRLGRLEVALRSLGHTDADESYHAADVGPLWASDVSPALKAMSRPVATPARMATPVALPPAPAARKPIEVMHGSKIEAR